MDERAPSGWEVSDSNRQHGGWHDSAARAIALIALIVAVGLWIPASFASACDACGQFAGVQAAARAAVAFSPMWLLLFASLTLLFRPVLIAFAAASALMTLVTITLGTGLRTIFEPLGLSSATGFAMYSIPYAVATFAALWDLGLRPHRPGSGDIPRH